MIRTQKIEFYQGTDFIQDFQLYELEEKAGNELDLTGCQAEFFVWAFDTNGPQVNLPYTITLSPLEGKISLTITSQASNGIAIPTTKFMGWYELKLTSSTGKIEQPFSGQLIIKK